jgi:hypothetical protein
MKPQWTPQGALLFTRDHMVVRGWHNGWYDSKVLPSGEGDIVKSVFKGIDMDVSGFCHVAM